jgi:hypothetical protein
MNRTVSTLLGWLIIAGITLGGLELGLRLAPELIPLTLLKRFHHQPRLEIARQRSLWNESQMRVLPRDDGGPTLKIFKPHSKIFYDFHGRDEKGVTLMDDQGFCNPPRDSYDRPTIDLVTIGDSFTWCVVLDPTATWTSQLGEITGLSVYNLGRGGIGPYDYLQILEQLGLPKQPAYVVMNIYEGNDLRDALRYHEHIQAASRGQILYTDAADRDSHNLDLDTLLDIPLIRDSYAINFVAAAIDKLYEGLKNAILRAVGGDAPETVDFHYSLQFADARVAFNLQNADESEVRMAHQLQQGNIDLSVLDDALSTYVELARHHGFTPFVAYSPSAYTTYAGFVEFDDPSLTELMPWFSRTQRDYLQNKSRELGFIFVDLTPALQAAARERRQADLLYHPINVHFTISGNRIVAETLATAVSSHQRHQTEAVSR